MKFLATILLAGWLKTAARGVDGEQRSGRGRSQQVVQLAAQLAIQLMGQQGRQLVAQLSSSQLFQLFRVAREGKEGREGKGGRDIGAGETGRKWKIIG